MRFNINLTACDMAQTVALTLKDEGWYANKWRQAAEYPGIDF